MDIITAWRADGYLYTWKGYLYLSNKKTPQKVYVKCHKAECGAGGSFPRDAARGDDIKLRKIDHCHPPENEYIEEMRFRHELRREAQDNPHLPMKLVYKVVAARYPEVAERVSFKGTKGLIQRHKVKEGQKNLHTAIDEFNQQEDRFKVGRYKKTRGEMQRPRAQVVEKDDVHLMLVGDIEQDQKESDETNETESVSSYVELLRDKLELEKRLRDLLKQLDITNARLTSIAFKSDTFDCFGKYVASLLRDLPADTVIKLKQQMIEAILKARMTEETISNPADELSPMPARTQGDGVMRMKRATMSNVDSPSSESVVKNNNNAKYTAGIEDDETSRSDNSLETSGIPDSHLKPITFKRKLIRNRLGFGKTRGQTGAKSLSPRNQRITQQEENAEASPDDADDFDAKSSEEPLDSCKGVEEAVRLLHSDSKSEEGEQVSSPTSAKVKRLKSPSKSKQESQASRSLRVRDMKELMKKSVIVICHICSKHFQTTELLMRHVESFH